MQHCPAKGKRQEATERECRVAPGSHALTCSTPWTGAQQGVQVLTLGVIKCQFHKLLEIAMWTFLVSEWAQFSYTELGDIPYGLFSSIGNSFPAGSLGPDAAAEGRAADHDTATAFTGRGDKC